MFFVEIIQLYLELNKKIKPFRVDRKISLKVFLIHSMSCYTVIIFRKCPVVSVKIVFGFFTWSSVSRVKPHSGLDKLPIGYALCASVGDFFLGIVSV